jgi:hypothetical protein
MKKYLRILFAPSLFFIVSSLVSSNNAQAAYVPDFQTPFDFSLLLSNSDIDLQTSDSKQPVSLDRISITVFSIIEPQLEFGFITGSSNLSLDNDAATAGVSLNGYHAGLALRSHLGRNPQIGFHAHYIYQEAKNETATQSATLSWHEWAAGISGMILLGSQLELNAGWAHHDIDARRRATGIINETQNLRLESDSQAQLGIAWRVHGGGHVGLSLQRGSYQQIEFRFSQKFQ